MKTENIRIGCTISENDIYDAAENERYSLGIKGKKTLFCIGVNPSTACPNKYDNTMDRLRQIATTTGYDSWIMFNLYPQRATDPDNLDKKRNEDIHERNLQIISNYLTKDNHDILCSWGNLIEKREYLKCCLKNIYDKITQKNNTNIKWLKIGDLTKRGNPRHILYARIDNGLEKMDSLKYYLKNIYDKIRQKINTKIKWLKADDLTIKGNPRHILFAGIDNGLGEFDMEYYLNKIF